MWIFARKGFLSIVEDKDRTEMLLVRGRIKGDIEAYFPDAVVQETPDNDYLYRTTLPRATVAAILTMAVGSIDYTNYKASVEKRRQLPYGRIWGVMIDLQEKFKTRRR